MRSGALIGLLALVGAVVAVAAPGPRPQAASAGERISVRLRPPTRPVRVYLAPGGVAATIRSRLDRRLHFVGVLQGGRRVLRFTVPPVDSGWYVVWCRTGCGPRVRIRVTTPTALCPVTLPREPRVIGNGLLSAGPPIEDDGTVVVGPDDVDPVKGLFWTKLGWAVKPGSVGSGELSVVLRRLDAAGAARAVETMRGDSRHPWSWRARMWFPGEGCFRVTGRVEDLALSFVVAVTRG